MADPRRRVLGRDSTGRAGVASALRNRASIPVNEEPAGNFTPFTIEHDEDGYVKGLLKKIRPTVRRSRDIGLIHVSEIISGCARRIALQRRYRIPPPAQVLWDGQAIMFSMGDRVHDFVKDRLAHGHSEKVWARWSCICGEESFTGVADKRPEKECSRCLSRLVKHNEVPFTSLRLNLVGNPDLLLFLSELGAFYPVEIKSVSSKIFEGLTRVRPDDRAQLGLYGYLLKEDSKPVADKGSVLYVNRDAAFKNPYKEFQVDIANFDHSPYMKDLEAINDSDAGGALPERVVCPSSDCSTASSCHVRGFCWAG